MRLARDKTERNRTHKFSAGTADIFGMSFLAEMLTGKQIEAVISDSEVTYLMLADGTQVTIRGLVVIQRAENLRVRSE